MKGVLKKARTWIATKVTTCGWHPGALGTWSGRATFSTSVDDQGRVTAAWVDSEMPLDAPERLEVSACVFMHP